MPSPVRQADLFDTPAAPPEPRKPFLAPIRRRIGQWLNLAQRAEVMPWSAWELARIERDFAMFTAVLPEDEAAELNASFRAEIQRLCRPPI